MRVKQNPPFLGKKVEGSPFCRLKKLTDEGREGECQFSQQAPSEKVEREGKSVGWIDRGVSSPVSLWCSCRAFPRPRVKKVEWQTPPRTRARACAYACVRARLFACLARTVRPAV